MELKLTSTGATQFKKIAATRFAYYQQNPSNPPVASLEAMDLDAVVVEAAVIEAPDFNGMAIISGAPNGPLTQQQANAIAASITEAAHS